MERIMSSSDSVVCSDKKKDEEDEAKLPGFRFFPTDEELVGFYLRKRVDNKPLRIDIIKHIDIYKYDPWDLPRSVNNVGDKDWYFFCMRGRKYKNSVRPNRVTGSGFWKATGIDKPIYSAKQPHGCVGLKKSLVYYRGHAGKGTKTDWMMHEFRLPPATKPENWKNTNTNIEEEAEVWTLCRIFKRIPSSSSRKYPPEGTATKITTPTGSSSKTRSVESDSGEHYVSFGDSVAVHQVEMKPVVDERHFLFGNHHVNNAAFGSGFWDSNGEDFIINENWDELTTVVERAIQTSRVDDYI